MPGALVLAGDGVRGGSDGGSSESGGVLCSSFSEHALEAVAVLVEDVAPSASQVVPGEVGLSLKS